MDTLQASCLSNTCRFGADLCGLQVYEIRVTRGVLGTSHVVERRYSEFSSLVTYIQEACGLTLPLPPKRMFGNKDLKFIHERREALDVRFCTALAALARCAAMSGCALDRPATDCAPAPRICCS